MYTSVFQDLLYSIDMDTAVKFFFFSERESLVLLTVEWVLVCER